ncbi:MAG: hypothetical protein E6G83_09940, partial [Alphaproteobacteria bacterium]
MLDLAGRKRPGWPSSRRSVGRAPACGRTSAPGRALGRTAALRGRTLMNGPERLTASEAVAQLTAGALTAEGLTRACLEQARAGAEIKAWAWLDPEQAIAQARAVDRAERKGLLAGAPVGIKDIIDTVDMPTGHGSP